jgi:hypothetical protein
MPKKTTPAIPVKGDPNPNKFYYWTVRYGVNAVWVADGFNLDDERAHSMLAHDLSHAYGHELEAEVLHAPDPREVAGEQGYETVEEADLGEVYYSKRRRDIAKRAEALTSAFSDILDNNTTVSKHTVTVRDILCGKLRNMIELALCEEMDVPWDAPMRKRSKR